MTEAAGIVKKEMLYEGKAKRVYLTDDENTVLVEYKDDATAFNGAKKGTITDKGILNNKIASIFFELLARNGVPTHYIKWLSEREMLVKKLDIVPIEVVVRNIVAGSLAKKMGMEEGLELATPILEFFYKNDELDDPMINRYYVTAFELATKEQMQEIEKLALDVNSILQPYLLEKGILLVDFKLEFGLYQGEIVLGDEISPDTCRFWDAETREKLDKDRFRRDLGGVEDAYQEILKRLQA